MKVELKKIIVTNDHAGCFGNFNVSDTICMKFCVLSLRCAVESNHNSRIELIEELLSSEVIPDMIQ